MKRLYERVAREDVQFFCFIFLKFKIYKMHLKIEGAYAPMFQNTTPLNFSVHL
jgi:hypothetical protein